LRARIASPSFPWHWKQAFTGCSSSEVCVASFREPRVASSRNGPSSARRCRHSPGCAAPAASWSAAGRDSVQKGDTRCRENCFVGEENGFNCVSPLMRLHRDATNGQAQTVRSASAKKYPARQFSSPSGVGHRMLRLLIFLRYPISIGRDARRRCAGFVQTQRL
jgi:hypothetical protein